MPNLTPAQLKHLQDLLEQFNTEASSKYEAGAIEHGGTLMDMSQEQLLDEAIKEAIDQFFYLATLKQKMRGEYGPTPTPEEQKIAELPVKIITKSQGYDLIVGNKNWTYKYPGVALHEGEIGTDGKYRYVEREDGKES